MTAHRIAIAHGTMAALYAAVGRGDMAEGELVKLVSWIQIQRGAGRE